MSKCAVFSAVAYVVIGFGTQSYIWNHGDIKESSDRGIVSVLGGAFWPITISGMFAHRLDFAITQSLKPLLICTNDHGRQWQGEWRGNEGLCLTKDNQEPIPSGGIRQ